MNAFPSVLLSFTPSGIQTVEYLRDSPDLLVGRVLEHFGPAMLAEQALIVRVPLVDLDEDHATRAGLIMQRVNGVGTNAGGDPAAKCDVVLRQLPIGVQRIGLIYGKVFLILSGIGRLGSFDHGGAV